MKKRKKKIPYKREEAGAILRTLLPSIMKKIYYLNNDFSLSDAEYKKEE